MMKPIAKVTMTSVNSGWFTIGRIKSRSMNMPSAAAPMRTSGTTAR